MSTPLRCSKITCLIEQLKAQGFIRARIDGKLVELDEAPKLTLRQEHTIEVVVDRLKATSGPTSGLIFPNHSRLGPALLRVIGRNFSLRRD